MLLLSLSVCSQLMPRRQIYLVFHQITKAMSLCIICILFCCLHAWTRVTTLKSSTVDNNSTLRDFYFTKSYLRT